MAGRSVPPASLLLLLLAALMGGGPRPPRAAAQMVSPLQGQGSPRPETRDVFVSVYLDRLLRVDDRDYLHEATFVFYISWNDSQAHFTIANNTARVAAGQATCARPCTDWAADISCCDDIYIPSFFFRNAYHFSQDRVTGYKIYALGPPNSSLLWTQVVQIVAYQPMDLSHFPFDSWDLILALEFLDTGNATHPGVAVHASSGGTQLYTLGLGDAVSGWHVESINISVADNVNSAGLFKIASSLPSDPRDPLPLGSGRAAVLRGTLPGASTTAFQHMVRLVLVRIRVSRFWSFHILNTILPVLLLGWISFIVFFLPRRELAARLGVIVTLFLALAAVQFVISDHIPQSSYILPTQQQVVLTYCLFALMAVESIVVFNIETWKEQVEEARHRRQARDRYLAACRARTAAAAAAAVAEAGPAPGEGAGTPPGPPADPGCKELGFPSAGAGCGCRDGAGGMEHSVSVGAGLPPMGSPHGAQPLTRKLTRIQSLQADAEYDSYVAWKVDRISLAVLLVGYTVGTILIFALQQGYVQLFPY